MLAPVYWTPAGRRRRPFRLLFAALNRDDDGKNEPGPEAPRGDRGLDGPVWVRLSVQVLVIAVALTVWAYSVKVRVDAGEPPEPLTFGILGLCVALAYGRVVTKWWKDGDR